MFAEIVTIGDEICRGEIYNTNAATLAEALEDLHISVRWITSCRDEPNDIRQSILLATERCQLVFASGGLGPTVDDCTVDTLAQLAGAETVVDLQAKLRLEQQCRKRDSSPNDVQLRQTRVPKNAIVFANPCGIAPGFTINLNKTPVYCMPGVPRELRAMLKQHIIPHVQHMLPAQPTLQKRTYRIFGIGESDIAKAIEPNLNTIQNLSVHFQTKFPETLVKLRVRHVSASQGKKMLQAANALMYQKLGQYLYGTDSKSLAEVLGIALQKQNNTLATAESCTGGMVGMLITAIPGSSAYYLGGAICYTDEEKQRQLDVSKQLLTSEGAVSEACAIAMAQGALARFSSHYAVSVTGIAGPTGATANKPIGLVWLAATNAHRYVTKKIVWPGPRDQVRTLAAHWALSLVRTMINEDK